MKTYEINCYEVVEADGGGVRSNHLCFVSNKELAETVKAKSPNWRSYSEYKRLITVFDTEEEINANTKEALRKSALAKLTAAEKNALGY